jgi:hypothetical protein
MQMGLSSKVHALRVFAAALLLAAVTLPHSTVKFFMDPS